MKLYLGRPSSKPSEERGKKNFAKFPKVMQTFFTYIDFFCRGRFSCVPARREGRERERERESGGRVELTSHTYSGLVSAHLL